MRKVERWIRTVMYVSLIIGAWALTLCQLSVFLDNQRAAEVRNAVVACMDYFAPHALIIDGKIFCYKTFGGTESVVSLEYLAKNYGKK